MVKSKDSINNVVSWDYVELRYAYDHLVEKLSIEGKGNLA